MYCTNFIIKKTEVIFSSLFFVLMTRQKKLQLSGIITAPLCKGSSAAGGEGLFFLQLSNRCAVSKPLSARPASVLRTLANPSNRFAVSEPLSATPASVLRTLANQTPLGEACKHAPHTCKSLTQGRLILIKPAPQAHLFSSIFSLIFYLKKPALEAGFFIKV